MLPEGATSRVGHPNESTRLASRGVLPEGAISRVGRMLGFQDEVLVAGSSVAAAEPSSTLCTPFFCSKVTLFITYLVALAVTGVLIWQLVAKHSELHVQAWSISAVFVVLTLPLSLRTIHLHMAFYVAPRLQRHYIRILLLVPIFSIESWFALRYIQEAEYLTAIRAIYEAFTIYSCELFARGVLPSTPLRVRRRQVLSSHPTPPTPLNQYL